MTTTITATPQPATASVLLEVTDDAGPVTVYDKAGSDLLADAEGWAGTWDVAAIEPETGLVRFLSSTLVTYTAERNFGSLTVGGLYRLDVRASRWAEPSTYTVSGIGTVTIPVGSGVWSHPLEFVATDVVHTLTLNVDRSYPALARVQLVHLPTDYTFSLLRADANGIRSVRLYEGQDIDGGVLIVTDYEAALAGEITYTVTTTESASATTALDLAQTWLTCPVAPQHHVLVDLVTGYAEASEAGTTVHQIIGREDPILTLRPLRMRTGTLEVWCPDYPTARAVRAVYGRGEIVLLRQADHPGLDMYHAATGRVSITPQAEETTPRRWKVSIEYTEVKVPTAALSGALGWTYAASAARNATYAASAAEFGTYVDLLIGPAA